VLCPSAESGCAIATVHSAWHTHTERNQGAIVRTSSLSAKLNLRVHSCTAAKAPSPTKMTAQIEKLQAAGVTSVGNASS
tara:strand:- start:456 stop:692 length:237 start_codon:yes stop_codon:yes gene_type:complete